MKKERIDKLLYDQGFANSAAKAQALVMSGVVLVNEKRVEKPSESFPPDILIRLKGDTAESRYVGRGGLKLEKALLEFHIRPTGYVCLDIGSSTGGFTDFLLQSGATEIVGFDVGHDQLHEKLKNFPNISFFEGLHAKDLSVNENFLAKVPANGFDLIVMDVSFISITKVIIFLKVYLKMGGEFLFLVKPQFELAAANLDRNGIVKEKKLFKQVQENIEKDARLHFGTVLNYIPSELSGKDGNQEFFIYGQKTI